MKNIVIIDNYDSFVYNLVQYLGEFNVHLQVFRNDKITVNKLNKLSPDAIVLSPGPGHPANPLRFGICLKIIDKFKERIPLLGVCLGHQGIAYYFGAEIEHAPVIMHGKTSMVYHDKKTIFKNLRSPLKVGRYHSLIVSNKKFPSELEISARTAIGEIMALRHKIYMVEGVQFHPESVLTPQGKMIVENFIEEYLDVL